VHAGKDSRRSRPSTRIPDSRQRVNMFSQDRCIFCDKHVKQVHGKKEWLQKCVTVTAENTIKQRAADKNDYRLLGIIGDEDLRAREACDHASYRKKYTHKET